MMKPIDNIYDDFINDPNQKARFTVDYPTNLPNTGSNSGPNMHWVMLKPDTAFFDTLVDSYLSTDYSPTWGWNNQGVRDFDGILGIKGFFSHYFSRVEPGTGGMLERCAYGNDNSNPLAIDPSGNTVCRDPFDCSDCRDTDVNNIKVIKMIQTCGKPWECTYDETWDATTKSTCEEFHRSWFSARVDFEESCWLGGPPSDRTGTFHPDVFMGFCRYGGLTGYQVMIPDKAAGDSVTTIPAPIPATIPAPIPVTSPPSPAPTLAAIAVTSPPSPAPTLPSYESLRHANCKNYAVHAGSAITFAANTIQSGDVGYVTALVGAYDLQDGELMNMEDSNLFTASVIAAHTAAMAPRAGTKLLAGAITGLTFTPGTYRLDAAVNSAAGSVITLDGLNEENPMFLFQSITLGTGANSKFIMKNGARAENVLWVVATTATLGADSILEGSILAGSAITMGANTILRGCALAQTAITFGALGSIENGAGTAELMRHLRGT
jgi:hypothetical protein